jgi:hypothetical protein
MKTQRNADDEAQQLAQMTRDPYRHMPQQVPFKREFAWGAFIFFAWVTIGSIAMMLVSHAKPFDGRSDLFLLVAAAMLVGVLGAVLQLVRLGSYPKEERPVGFALAGLALPIGLFLAWVGAWMVHTAAYVPSYMGRRHRKGKKLLAPETEAGADWMGAPETDLARVIPEGERAALGAEWRDNGKKEHASVAAFAQLTLDLMAVGAPPELVAAAQRDALDEVRHAAACFAIARDIDGLVESPAPFPDARARRFLFTGSRSIALTQIAIDALADGVLNEGIAARLLAQLARTCESPALAAILREMAADESRHAAHSWDIVAWCVGSGGATVANALRGAVSGMPKKVCSALPAGARDGAWERWGVHGVAMEAAAFEKTREAARAKLAALLEDYSDGRRLRRAATTPAITNEAMTAANANGTSAAHASHVYVR